jgi:hypothetical protein
MDEQTVFRQASAPTGSGEPTQRQRRSSLRGDKRKEEKKRRKQPENSAKTNKDNPPPQQLPEVPSNALPFDKVLRLLQEAKLPGFTSRESLRRAFHAGKLPGYVKGKNRLFFKPEPVFELIGGVPVGDGGSVDQALIRHYESNEFNTPITAMMAGLVGNLGKAHQVFKDWIKMKNDPDVAARIEAKARAEAAKTQKVEEPVATTCESCGRSPEQADKDDAGINLAVTGRAESPNASEMLALSEFQDQKCTGCWKWLPSAPTTSMREHLAPKKT